MRILELRNRAGQEQVKLGWDDGSESWVPRGQLNDAAEKLLSDYFAAIDAVGQAPPPRDAKPPRDTKRGRSPSPSPVVTYSPRLVKVLLLCFSRHE